MLERGADQEEAPIFEPVPIAAGSAFQTLGFRHGIRRMDRWQTSVLPIGMTKSRATLSHRGSPIGTSAVDVGSFYP